MNNETEQIFLLNTTTSQSSEPVSRMGTLVPPPSQVNLENVKDFSHVCRTCATITEFVMPIYSGEGLQNNLADKIRKHLPIQVSENDELPLVVCFQCASTLLAFHELVKCCEQADAALQAKLRSNKRKLNGALNTKEEDPKTKQALAQYVSCVYCPTSQPAACSRQHLVLVHGDLLFHCERCDAFVDRRDFIAHMSFHALHADAQQRLQRVMRRHPTPPPPEPEAKPLVKIEARKNSVTKTKTIQVNEFSDHSDMEDFAPLPESVFEAIEDTQDSQHLDNADQTPDSERLNDESNKSTSPENINSSNLGQCLENNNNLTNNCSVVIEPIDINSCAQNMNIVINKNTSTDTSDSPVPPADETPSKPADSGQSEQGKRNRNKLRKCPLCPKEYRASSSYFYHLKYTHNSSKEHECEVCGRKFGTRACLTQHMAVHSAQYDFECKQCEKRFKSKAGLYIHEQTHGGKKMWSCGQCAAAFRWRAQLRRHLARHAGVRAHACRACGRAFSVRADLLRHARTHAAAAHACDLCGQTFAQLRYLKAHTTKQHKTDTISK